MHVVACQRRVGYIHRYSLHAEPSCHKLGTFDRFKRPSAVPRVRHYSPRVDSCCNNMAIVGPCGMCVAIGIRHLHVISH